MHKLFYISLLYISYTFSSAQLSTIGDPALTPRLQAIETASKPLERGINTLLASVIRHYSFFKVFL